MSRSSFHNFVYKMAGDLSLHSALSGIGPLQKRSGFASRIVSMSIDEVRKLDTPAALLRVLGTTTIRDLELRVWWDVDDRN